MMGEMRLIGPFSAAQTFSHQEQDDGSLVVKGGKAVSIGREFPEDHAGLRYMLAPGAFDSKVVSQFMKKPVLLWAHNMEEQLGRVTGTDLKSDGLFNDFVVRPTRKGRDIISLIKAGDLMSQSIGFNFSYDDMTDNEVIKDDEVKYRLVTIHHVTRLNEISIVPLGMDDEAMFGIEKNQKFYQIQQPYGNGGPIIGERKMSDTPTIPVEVQEVKATVSNLKKETVENHAKLVADIQKVRDENKLSSSELQTFIEKLSADFTATTKALIDAQKEALTQVQAGVTGTQDQISFTAEQAVLAPENRLRRVLTRNRYDEVDEFRRINDELVFADMIASHYGMKFRNGKHISPSEYKQMGQKERMSLFSAFKVLENRSRAFAVDTSTSGEGSQYLPTAYSSKMINAVKLQSVVAGMHPVYNMKQSPEVVPVEGADILATRATEQTPGSANLTLTAEKLRTRVQISGEATEDLIIDIMDYVMSKSQTGFARSIDKACISGDDTAALSFDSGDVPGSTDCRYCWDGFRALVEQLEDDSLEVKVDLGSFGEQGLANLRSKLGKYGTGLGNGDFYWLTSIGTYLKHILDPDKITRVTTIDKYGPQATINTGELAKYSSKPIIISEFVLDTFDEAGVYSAAGKTKSIVLAVNRPAFMHGVYRPITMEVVRGALDDVWDIVGWHRRDFVCPFEKTTNTETFVALGYNIPV